MWRCSTGNMVCLRWDYVLSLIGLSVLLQVTSEPISLSDKETRHSNSNYRDETGKPYSSSLATDGDTGTVFGSDTCARTINGLNPWWRVNLGMEYVISSVTLYRADGTDASNSLAGVQIFIGSCGGSGSGNIACGSVISTQSDITASSTPGSSFTRTCSENTVGQFVYVRKMGDGGSTRLDLTLCEVQIDGYPASVVDQTQTQVVFNMASLRVSESDGSLKLALNRSGTDMLTCTSVEIWTIEDVAMETVDYLPLISETVDFPPGVEEDMSLSLFIVDDDIKEPLENLTVALQITFGGSSDIIRTVITVVDDDTIYFLKKTSDNLLELDGFIEVIVVRSGFINDKGRAFVACEDDTALEGIDYTCSQSELMFAPGEDTAAFRIEVSDNNDVDLTGPGKTFKVVLYNASANINPSRQTTVITIQDDDAFYSLEMAEYSVPETAGEFHIAIIRTGNTDVPGNVYVAYNDKTAKFNTDYFAENKTLATFDPYASQVDIKITVFADNGIHGGKVFQVKIYEPSRGIIGENSEASVTILNYEAFFEIKSTSISLWESNETAVVEIQRRGYNGSESWIRVSTLDGTAVSPQDYGHIDLTLHFPSGMTSSLVTINIVNDSEFENETETFQVVLQDQVGAYLHSDDESLIITIIDDDDEKNTTTVIPTTGLRVATVIGISVALVVLLVCVIAFAICICILCKSKSTWRHKATARQARIITAYNSKAFLGDTTKRSSKKANAVKVQLGHDDVYGFAPGPNPYELRDSNNPDVQLKQYDGDQKSKSGEENAGFILENKYF